MRSLRNFISRLKWFFVGCDSGFGEASAIALSKEGFKVIAGCLTDEGVARLSSQVFRAVKCNVTKENDIKNIEKLIEDLVKNGPDRLWAVINNAGIGEAAYSDWCPMDVYQRTFDINFFAIVRMVKCLLPYLKMTKNCRIINLSSMAGIVGAPAMAAYCGTNRSNIIMQ
jgi:NAD(P)-dependent dehydrogenase (short-subunit alcohol dehydrogenase family)